MADCVPFIHCVEFQQKKNKSLGNQPKRAYMFGYKASQMSTIQHYKNIVFKMYSSDWELEHLAVDWDVTDLISISSQKMSVK